ncbi:MAG: hypothetical protein PUD39_04665, partial [Bacteroidales bacterium]|nr:hypothetical protein [Bacteroidales bacterium]
ASSATPIWNALGIFVIVSLCCFGMCFGRAERNKFLGNSVQIALGAVIFFVLIMGAVPFTNFLDVLGKSKEIHQNVEEVFNYASDLDNRYTEYANSRIKDYEYVLSPEVSMPEGSFLSTRPRNEHDYEVSVKLEALRRIILPESRQSIVQERQKWLDNSRGMSLWNVATPDNLRILKSVVDSWIDDYRTLSSNGIEDESFEPFADKEFSTSINTYTAQFTQYHFPSIIAILITIIVFGIILLPYFLTEPWTNGNNENGEKQGKGAEGFKFTWI